MIMKALPVVADEVLALLKRDETLAKENLARLLYVSTPTPHSNYKNHSLIYIDLPTALPRA